MKRAAAIVIGASAGGVEALMPLLARLTPRCPPVLVVLHLPRDRPSMLASIFGRASAVPVVDAIDKMPLEPGTVVCAAPDYHLLVDRGPRVALSIDEPILFSRPAVDVLFESAADLYGPALLAIVLTGGNEDGAAGAGSVARAGGTVVVQDPGTARAPEMPSATLARAPSARVLDLAAIGALLQDIEFEDIR